MKNALILLAGGKGERFNKGSKGIPKQFIKAGKNNLIEYFLSNLEEKIFDIIVIVTQNINVKKYLPQLNKKFPQHKISFSKAGTNRQLSVKYGLNHLKKYNPSNVLIHDSVRPLVTNKLIKKQINFLKKNFSCIPFVINNDLKKNKIKKNIIEEKQLIYIQTPQAFKYKVILKAHQNRKLKYYRDDSTLLDKLKIKNKYILGEKTNFKITYKDDLELFKKLIKKDFRSGIGYDIHKIDLNSKKKLILCGVKINHPPLIGHSDADVGYHAICDSILGSLSMRDIGTQFPNNKKKWKNANSKIFMKFCYEQLKKNKHKIINLDINFICEKPKINKYIKRMKNNISKILNVNKNIISIKATTNEKISFIGKGEAIAAESIVQIRNE